MLNKLVPVRKLTALTGAETDRENLGLETCQKLTQKKRKKKKNPARENLRSICVSVCMCKCQIERETESKQDHNVRTSGSLGV